MNKKNTMPIKGNLIIFNGTSGKSYLMKYIYEILMSSEKYGQKNLEEIIKKYSETEKQNMLIFSN